VSGEGSEKHVRQLPARAPFAQIPGEMADRVRGHDWARTELGDLSDWPKELTSAVSLILMSPVPMAVMWGSGGILIYNDAYALFAGDLHPALLGMKAREGWAQFAEFTGNILNTVLAGGTLARRDVAFSLRRSGEPQQVWMDIDCSPILDGEGSIRGALVVVVETTERVAANLALRRSEERLRQATENADIALWDVDPEERISLLYARERRAFSMPQDRQTPVDEFFAHVHPDDRAMVKSAWAEARDPGKRSAIDMEYRTLAMPGIPARWMAVKGRAVFDEEGRCTGMSGTAIDITKRKEAELGVRESEQRFREIANAAPVIIWIADPEGACSWFNRSALDFTGRSLEAELGSGWADNLHPDDHERVLTNFRDAYTSRAPFRIVFRLRRKDGEWRTLDETAVPRFDEAGNFLGFIGTCTDVTERHEAEEALREKEEQLRVATEQGEVGLWDHDVERGRSFSDARVKAMFGAPPDFEGTPDEFFAMVHPDDVKRVTAAYADAFDPLKRAIYDEEYRVIGLDGVTRWVAATGRGMFDAQGRCLRVSGSARDITREKEIAGALRESEERLRLATEAAEVGFWDVDNVAGTLVWPARVKAMFGISPDVPVTMKDYYSGVHPDDRETTFAAYRDANDPSKRTLYDVEYRTIGKEDGIVRWVAAKGRGVFDDQGRCIRVIGTAIDITRQKEIAEALRRGEEQLRLATEYAEVGLWDIDVLNDTLYWPPHVNRMFGMPADHKVTLKEFRACIHPDDRRRVVGAILAACDPKIRAPYDVEYRIVRHDDGRVRWLAVRGKAAFDDQDRCVRMLGVVLDITARKEIEAELRELTETLERRVAERTAELAQSEKNIRAILETSHLYQGLMSADGTLLYMNATALSGIRANFDEVVGKHFWETPWFEATPGLPATIKSAVLRVAEGDTANMNVLLNLPIGTRSFDFSLRPVRDVDGNVVAMVPEAVDVTARVKAESALQQAHKMEAIGNLTGGIAHDFNNLLQGLTGSLDLIRRKPDDRERVRRWAEAGLQAAERGAKLTAQLLAFSRSQKLEVAPIDLSRLLQESRELLMRTLGPKVRVTLDLDMRANSALGDETQLEMAVLNLAINARDAMPEGGDVVISTRRRMVVDDAGLEPGEYVELSVSDTGSGMPADVVARAFDPFFTTKGVGKGTGLGLSQVYGMARQAGGSARIRSTAGQGTTVSILLRASDHHAAHAASQRAADETQATASATVLIVDDDPGVRQFLAESLESFGYAVLQAEDGKAGLALIERAAPDVLIVDYAMPGLTGAEVAHRARARHAHLPVIFASGYADTSALEEVLHRDSTILRKPFRVNELQDAVKRALGGAK